MITNKELINNYLISLKDRIFKILPLFEEENDGLFKYIDSLSHEMCGLQNLVVVLNNNYLYLSVLGTLESLLDEAVSSDYDLKMVRSDVFRCMTCIDKLLDGDKQ